MSEEGKLEADQLFKGLTRPAMLMGVTLSLCAMNLMITMLTYVITQEFKVLLLPIVLHGIFYVISFKEPMFFEIFMARTQKCNKCTNKLYYGADSYDVK